MHSWQIVGGRQVGLGSMQKIVGGIWVTCDSGCAENSGQDFRKRNVASN
jgi:hypothetical protein